MDPRTDPAHGYNQPSSTIEYDYGVVEQRWWLGGGNDHHLALCCLLRRYLLPSNPIRCNVCIAGYKIRVFAAIQILSGERK